jgi:dUTP pyrophosphatase
MILFIDVLIIVMLLYVLYQGRKVVGTSTFEVRVIPMDGYILCPTKAHHLDAGYDIFLPHDVTVEPHKKEFVKLGFGLDLPDELMASVRLRSSTGLKTTVLIPNQPGTIDPGYQGEVGITLYNYGDISHTFKKGEKIGQIIFEKVYNINMLICDDFKCKSARGGGGFGSSGK